MRVLLVWLMLAGAAFSEPLPQISLEAPQARLAREACRSVPPKWQAWRRDLTLRRTFVDAFDGFEAGKVWTPHYDHNGYDDWRARTLEGNNERQIYVDPGFRGAGLDPFEADGGVLSIIARKQGFAGFDYTSGVITSRASHLQRYGYFEIRAKVPEGRGLWPAFWMLQPGKWPPEIDVFEVLGDRPDLVHMHVHWERRGQHMDVGCKLALPGASKRYVTYGVLWTPQMLVRYIDRVPVAMTRTPEGLDAPMYMIANLAVGGDWPGAPDETTRFPARLQIDWIAAYEVMP